MGLRHAPGVQRRAALSEILLGEDVAGHLRPGARHLDVLGAEYQGTVGVTDLARGPAELDPVVNFGASFRDTTRNPHSLVPIPALTVDHASRRRCLYRPGCLRVWRRLSPSQSATPAPPT